MKKILKVVLIILRASIFDIPNVLRIQLIVYNVLLTTAGCFIFIQITLFSGIGFLKRLSSVYDCYKAVIFSIVACYGKMPNTDTCPTGRRHRGQANKKPFQFVDFTFLSAGLLGPTIIIL